MERGNHKGERDGTRPGKRVSPEVCAAEVWFQAGILHALECSSAINLPHLLAVCQGYYYPCQWLMATGWFLWESHNLSSS